MHKANFSRLHGGLPSAWPFECGIDEFEERGYIKTRSKFFVPPALCELLLEGSRPRAYTGIFNEGKASDVDAQTVDETEMGVGDDSSKNWKYY